MTIRRDFRFIFRSIIGPFIRKRYRVHHAPLAGASCHRYGRRFDNPVMGGLITMRKEDFAAPDV
ncbi:MAG: hypothetical protein EHM12_06770 [Dehalococcoidia bacterium]|nr:MAG: hypothetical protein EHM12_06770 [Dehalococcoidia bacterium]